MNSYLQIKNINLSKKLQMRQNGVSGDVIETYAKAMKDGAKFPHVVVFQIDRTHYLVDGWHRLKATELNGLPEIWCEVIEGSMDEALAYARFTANRTNGQRLSRADMDVLLSTIVNEDQYKNLSSTALAEIAGVSAPTVIAKRRKLGLIPDEVVTATGAVRKGSIEVGTSFPIDSLIDGAPPLGTPGPADGGFPVLTQKVCDRLREHLVDVQTSLNKLEGAELSEWINDPTRDELVGEMDRLSRILGSA
ncbi:ParB/RepB/Spo0J family partition protein [bacterium]|nr:ParB/RepB/Spo0J family partition protein [bacterium]